MTDTLCHITIDTYQCNGCGSCAELCPTVFHMDEVSGRAEARTETVPMSHDLQQAASFCPCDCIELSC